MTFRDAPSTADLDAMGPKDLSGGSGPLRSESDLSIGSGYGYEVGGAGANRGGTFRGVLDAASAGAGEVSEGRKGDVLGLSLVAVSIFVRSTPFLPFLLLLPSPNYIFACERGNAIRFVNVVGSRS